jgi:hypothetical protein
MLRADSGTTLNRQAVRKTGVICVSQRFFRSGRYWIRTNDLHDVQIGNRNNQSVPILPKGFVGSALPEWRTEIPFFIAKINETFEPWRIAQFLEAPRRLGALGHTADEEGHKLYRNQLDESENLREDSRNLILFEQAREWLLEDQA